MKTQMLYVSSALILTVLSACNDPSSTSPSVSMQTFTESTPATANNVSTTTPVTLTRFVYAANRGDDTISAFGVNMNDYSLVPVGNTVGSYSQPFAMRITPNKQFMYVLCANSTSISQYSVNQTTGELTWLPNGNGNGISDAKAIGYKTDGSMLYVSHAALATVSGYTINYTTGQLQYVNDYTLASVQSAGVTFATTSSVVYDNQFGYQIFGNKLELYTKKSNGNFYDSGVGYYSGSNPVALAFF